MEINNLNPIGKVINGYDNAASFHEIKSKPSAIEIFSAFADGLYKIEQFVYLDIVFYFHKSEGYTLVGPTHSGEVRGVFASRSPSRPNSIGITTVKLLERKANMLIVEGLDALNETPVLDIKCTDTSLFAVETESQAIHNAMLRSAPRTDIRNNIVAGKTEVLMLKAGQLHGHFCPGLAMGVMAATHAMQLMKADSDGMEDLLAITETNNCFSDGVQFVTGCSFGNNALIFKDLGKTAFTLTKRDGKGIRICSRHESQEALRKAFPEFYRLYRQVVSEKNHHPERMAEYQKASLERAFGTLNIPFDELFTVSEVNVPVPAYAPVHESVVCAGCGESVMQSRTVSEADRYYCFSCKHISPGMLTGQGINQ